MDLSPNHASADGINRLSVDSINWLGENMLKPLYNSGVVEPERAVVSTVKGVAGLNLPMLEVQNVQQAQPWSAASVARVGDQAEAPRVKSHGWIRIIGPIEHIEDLDTELRLQPLLDLEFLEQ